mmetsp:Transcript_32482/g.56158  ORF Transcript_32482/g.56158 Transcript_32482/m.56158 type:complete len:174 (-) Transcript_32482:399-920(-)|eukprot:CAMPEP_0194584692 /NCGR_PEP_ID=MMETSP0292-20121207/17212_1 /TAXON_ID=39354 /ORGANISM="Heterosigma akashiwo, Strain CCMP2393" /LENGTH=173 /DNA_ID=CAMNT_0039439805 /DNA_START=226 /DNA_END=747 /DNA_ORIENTATION=-
MKTSHYLILICCVLLASQTFSFHIIRNLSLSCSRVSSPLKWTLGSASVPIDPVDGTGMVFDFDKDSYVEPGSTTPVPDYTIKDLEKCILGQSCKFSNKFIDDHEAEMREAFESVIRAKQIPFSNLDVFNDYRQEHHPGYDRWFDISMLDTHDMFAINAVKTPPGEKKPPPQIA